MTDLEKYRTCTFSGEAIMESGQVCDVAPQGRCVDLDAVAAALDLLDSHAIYDHTALTDLAHAGIDTDRLSFQSVPQLEQAIRERGLGGNVMHADGCASRRHLDGTVCAFQPLEFCEKPTRGCTCRLYTGHIVSREVVTQLGYAPEGARYFGRGSAHRANVEQLQRIATSVRTAVR